MALPPHTQSQHGWAGLGSVLDWPFYITSQYLLDHVGDWRLEMVKLLDTSAMFNGNATRNEEWYRYCQ